jgi:hypothetical protein
MTRTMGLVACLLALCLSAPRGATANGEGEHGEQHVTLTPDKLKWEPNPVLPPGAKVALLSGNPTKAGELFAVRIPPHWHPTDECVTVLRGEMLFGTGERFDASVLKEAPAASYTRMPRGMRHFAMTKGETVIQLHGIGPFEIHYVNPGDDPRQK